MKVKEENFLVELRKRNEKSIEYVIDNYGSLAHGIIRKVLLPLGNEGLIEECVNDVFLSVWNNIDKFNGDNNNFKNWIGGISKYKAIDYYRKYSNEKNKVEEIDENISNNDTLEEGIIKGIETSYVMNLINKFKEPDRSIFIMKFLYGYTSKKISSILGITVSSIDTKVNRGRKLIKKKYDDISMEEYYG